jgi:hypothetical protein
MSFESSTVCSYSVPSVPMGHHDATSAQAVCDASALQGDPDALAPQGDPDAIEHSCVYEDSSIYQTPAVSCRYISEYARSHVTPAPQPLITIDDLVALSRDTHGHMHCQSRETVSFSNKPISLPLCDNPSISTTDRNSFSIINLTNPIPTPQLAGASSLLQMEDPTRGEIVCLLDLQFTSIAAITTELRNRKGSGDNILGMLRITFEPSQVNQFFPKKFKEFLPENDLCQVPCYRIHNDYVGHLSSVMDLAADMLNAFFQASGTKCRFSFGDSAYYQGCTFEELLYREWTTRQLARRFELQVLKCIRSAYHAISVFTNLSESPFHSSQEPSLALTNNFDFTCKVQEILDADYTPTSSKKATSPSQEDEHWAAKL